MDYESLICDFAGSCRRKDFEKAAFFCDALNVFCGIAKLKYKEDAEEHFRHLLSSAFVYYDSGIDFEKLCKSVHNVLDATSMIIVEEEYVLYDDTQGKRIYIDRRSFNNDTIYFLFERAKGEF